MLVPQGCLYSTASMRLTHALRHRSRRTSSTPSIGNCELPALYHNVQLMRELELTELAHLAAVAHSALEVTFTTIKREAIPT
jgi:hypothetical protein